MEIKELNVSISEESLANKIRSTIGYFFKKINAVNVNSECPGSKVEERNEEIKRLEQTS